MKQAQISQGVQYALQISAECLGPNANAKRVAGADAKISAAWLRQLGLQPQIKDVDLIRAFSDNGWTVEKTLAVQEAQPARTSKPKIETKE